MSNYTKLNINSKKDAVEYVDKNLDDLMLNITNVSEDIIRAYADLKEFIISIQAINKDSYMEHEDKIIYILTAIDISKAYLSKLEDKVNDYYKPEDYYDSRLKEIRKEIESHLIEYVDEFSPDVTVRYPESTSKLSEYMVIDDGKVQSVRQFL